MTTNLFNKNTVKPNTSLNGVGDEYTVIGQNLSEFIKVEPNSQYTLNTPSTNYVVFSYTENRTYISQNVRAGIFTTGANTGWIRLMVRNQDLENAQLNKGETLLPYEVGYNRLSDNVQVDIKPYHIIEPIPTAKRTLLGESKLGNAYINTWYKSKI